MITTIEGNCLLGEAELVMITTELVMITTKLVLITTIEGKLLSRGVELFMITTK